MRLRVCPPPPFQARAAVRGLPGPGGGGPGAAQVLRSELECLQGIPVATLGTLRKDGSLVPRPDGGDPLRPVNSLPSTGASVRKDTVGGNAQNDDASGGGGGYSPAWGEGSRPCELCLDVAAQLGREGKYVYAALGKWRPVISLLSSLCTASTGAGGLQVTIAF